MPGGGTGPLYVLDGNSLVFRAFFALPADLATTSGQVTNAVHGFTSMLVNLIRDHDPSGMAVAFDRPEPTFRDELVEEYKANRPEMPDVLGPQFDLVRAILDALGIRRLEVAGYEADDVLATLATQARDAGRDVVVVTGDRDAFQLVEDPHVKVLYTRKGISDTVLYDEAGIEARYGVTPAEYPLFAALRGDQSDNLPGVPGVGEKTAATLVRTYRTLDGIFAHLDELSPKLRASLAAHEDQVRRNAVVTPLVRDLPLDVSLDELRLGRWDRDEVRRLFGELELRTLWQRLAPLLGEGSGADGRGDEGAGGGAPVRALLDGAHVRRVARAAEACRVLQELAGAVGPGGAVALAPAWSGEPGRSALGGLALVRTAAPGLARQGAGGEEALWLEGAVLDDTAVRGALAALVGPGGVPIVAHGAKELMRVLLPAGVDVTGLVLDTAVAAYLLDPSAGRYGLADVVEAYLGTSLDPDAPAAAGQLALDRVDDAADADDRARGAARQAAAVALLAGRLRPALEAERLVRLHDEVECPLVRVLARMEVAGIAVDADQLRRTAKELASECEQLQRQIHRLAGETFNVNSTPQLRAVLYDKLGLAPGKKTKTGYSTDAQTLERLRGEHPIIDALLRYREVEKLRSTYGETLLAEVAPDGRIHATFHQTVARTGRLSSDRPNLHNIPVRTEEGRALRRAFVPAPGCSFLVADYDQIELRVIAHLSGDPGLVAAFASHQDVHRATAARVFGVPPEEVTAAQRNRAKMVSYGLAYGMEAFGLGQRLGIATAEAQEILDAYFAAFPAVRAYMERTVAEARAKGYTETLLGRRRPLPDLRSPNRGLRLAAERQAMNAGIQGLAADLFKVALVRVDRALEQRALAARLVLQVHDEVLVEVPAAEQEEVGGLVPEVLVGVGDAVGLQVPLEVSVAWGATWADAKD